jgi:hypothetical protein
MREELEEVLELYERMPPEGQQHWCARSLPSVRFQSEAERDEFLAALRERDKQPSAPAAEASTSRTPNTPGTQGFRPGQRVKVNLSGMQAGGVSFSQNVDAAWATIQRQVSADPPVYHVELLFSFRGVREIDVPAERIRPL